MKREVCDALYHFCIPANLTGHSYIAEAVAICLDNPAAIYNMADIYEAIGESAGKKTCNVERSIRYAIQYACKHLPPEQLSSFVNPRLHTGKPANSLFLAQLTEWIRMQADE